MINTDQSLEERFSIAKQRTDNDVAAAILVLASAIEGHAQVVRDVAEDTIAPELATLAENVLHINDDEREV